MKDEVEEFHLNSGGEKSFPPNPIRLRLTNSSTLSPILSKTNRQPTRRTSEFNESRTVGIQVIIRVVFLSRCESKELNNFFSRKIVYVETTK